MPSGGGSAPPTLLRLDRWLYKAAKQLGSEAAKCNILFSPLEGEKKFLGELCELRNFREGYKKYKTLDRATECAMTDVGDKKGKIIMNKNNLQQKQPNNPAASPETNHSPLTIHHSPKRIAFTLAEVLITLGIIGVVAALTLPSVINKYKRKQLEVAFIRSSSLIQQVLKQTANDFGYDNFNDINKVCPNQNELNRCKWINQEFFKSINANFVSKFRVLKKAKGINAAKFENKIIPTYNYIGKQGLYYSQLYGIENGGYFLADGTYITGLTFFYHGSGDGITMTFDTNGPYKGPNRFGYDIFLYTTGDWGSLCSKEKSLADGGPNSSLNGRGCYKYALKNINPDDNTKGYWESLYK